MTAVLLQSALIDELNYIFADFKLSSKTGKLVNPKVYPQELPISESNDEDENIEVTDAPYVLVRINSGSVQTLSDPHLIKIIIAFCIYDKSIEHQGHIDVLNMISRVYERFAKNSYLKNFEYIPPFEWALHDEDTYPYYFGALEINFNCPEIRKEDMLA